MKKALFFMCLSLSICAYSSGFDIVTLGSDGGVYDGNTTDYLLKSKTDTNYVALDAGTILPGIKKGLEKDSFKDIIVPKDSEWTDLSYIFREKVKGYLITHGHLDHISGLVISSTEDTKKEIYGLKSTIDNLKNNVFNWDVWPNFGNEGNGFKLNQYTYKTLETGKEIEIVGTNLKVRVYPLSHSNHVSTLFLVESNDEYFAFYGDVGPDEVEKTTLLEDSFKILGPLLKEGKLKGIVIETSFVNATPDKALFGHLTPNWLNNSLDVLSKYSGTENLKGLDIIINHIKPSLKKGVDPRATIIEELTSTNKYKVNYHFPTQGDLVSVD